MSFIRQFLVCMAVAGLIQGPHAQARASDRDEEIKDFLELLPPDGGKSEQLTAFYDRVSVRLPEQMRLQIMPYIAGKPDRMTPPLTVKGNEVFVTENGKTHSVKFEESGKRVWIYLDGKKLTENQLSSGKNIFEAVRDAAGSSVNSKSQSLLLELLRPREAQAFELSTGWLVLGITVAAAAGIWWWKSNQAKKAQEAADLACSTQCCFNNTTKEYAILCCGKSAGWYWTGQSNAVASQSCPVGCTMTTEGWQKCQYNPNKSAGVSTSPITIITAPAATTTQDTVVRPTSLKSQH